MTGLKIVAQGETNAQSLFVGRVNQVAVLTVGSFERRVQKILRHKLDREVPPEFLRQDEVQAGRGLLEDVLRVQAGNGDARTGDVVEDTGGGAGVRVFVVQVQIDDVRRLVVELTAAFGAFHESPFGGELVIRQFGLGADEGDVATDREDIQI